MYIYIYTYTHITRYINRYSVIAEGLFIITFEKLPCFTKKKEEKAELI